MFIRHVSRQLAAQLDGSLPPRKERQIDLHLQQCPRCRAEREQIEWGMAVMAHLPSFEAPETIWLSIEASLSGNRPRGVLSPLWLRGALAAALVLVLAGTAYWHFARIGETRWQVTALDGSPSVAAKSIHGVSQIAPGEWVETDASSRASVKIGEIGSVEVAPNTRLRIVTARPGEHRLALAHGEIRATISAPPKLFFVDTASGTAVDLGCEYTLNTREDGLGLLRVTKGWVSFQWKGLESLVPAGASCRTLPQSGPGIPYFEDAPEKLKEALMVFGLEKSTDDALGVILGAARVRDTLTLWHLLRRVDPSDRGRVFDRIAALTPVPAGVSRDLALKLDAPTLERWREELAWTW